jgi:hypothetical protein
VKRHGLSPADKLVFHTIPRATGSGAPGPYRPAGLWVETFRKSKTVALVQFLLTLAAASIASALTTVGVWRNSTNPEIRENSPSHSNRRRCKPRRFNAMEIRERQTLRQVARERCTRKMTTGHICKQHVRSGRLPPYQIVRCAFSAPNESFKAVGTILPKVSFDSNGGISLESFSHRNGIAGRGGVDDLA